MTESYDRFNEFRRGKTKTTTISSTLEGTTKKIDSTTADIKTNLNSALKNLDSTERAEVIKSIPIITNDSVLKNTTNNKKLQINAVFILLCMFATQVIRNCLIFYSDTLSNMFF